MRFCSLQGGRLTVNWDHHTCKDKRNLSAQLQPLTWTVKQQTLVEIIPTIPTGKEDQTRSEKQKEEQPHLMCGGGWGDPSPARDPDWVGQRKKEGNKREVMTTEPVFARSNNCIVFVAGLLVALLPQVAVTMDTSSWFAFQICRCASLCAADRILVFSVVL